MLISLSLAASCPGAMATQCKIHYHHCVVTATTFTTTPSTYMPSVLLRSVATPGVLFHLLVARSVSRAGCRFFMSLTRTTSYLLPVVLRLARDTGWGTVLDLRSHDCMRNIAVCQACDSARDGSHRVDRQRLYRRSYSRRSTTQTESLLENAQIHADVCT